jgi:urea transport system substrate-binding protein
METRIFEPRQGIDMKSASVLRGIVLGLLLLQLSLVVPAARAGEDTIKIGILHSLSGTMAISESVLKDTVLMMIEDQNKKGGLLGRKLEPIIVDPASDWDVFAEKARELLTKEKVAVVFGCWTSVSRKSVLPIFEQLNGLLFYPVQYEGEESSRNIFYTGAAPNQQAIPAVRYLMSKEGGEVRRWVLLGTDAVFPRTTNRILSAYLTAKGVSPDDITTIYTPFGYSEWRGIVEKIKAFGSEGIKTAVISTVSGDANTYFYRELADQQVDANAIPVMALSIGEREFLGADIFPVGHLAARNYFQSIKSAENEAFIKMWTDFNEQRDKTTNDPMEATFIGFRMWAQAVGQAGTIDVDAVRQAMYGQRIKAPSGFEVVMNNDHHLSKPVMIGKMNSSGTFDVIWQSIDPVRADVWSRYIPDSAKRTADWTFPWVCGGCIEPTFKEW